MKELIYPVAELKETLSNFEKYVPFIPNGLISDFCHLLSENLHHDNPEFLSPRDFALSAFALVKDLKRGKNTQTYEVIKSSLVGRSEEDYNYLLSKFRLIAENSGLPDDFIDEVVGFLGTLGDSL